MSMEVITYSGVQELVKSLPEAKLPLAYAFLRSLAESDIDALPPQVRLLLSPPTERQSLMAQQAEKMVAYYEQTAAERDSWQAGDFVDAS